MRGRPRQLSARGGSYRGNTGRDSLCPARPVKLIATRYIGNILVVPANGVGHHLLDYSHPRSLKAERSTPGGAYHPLEPYRAPSFIATSLLP